MANRVVSYRSPTPDQPLSGIPCACERRGRRKPRKIHQVIHAEISSYPGNS